MSREVEYVFVYGSLLTDMFNYKKYLAGKVLTCQKGYIRGTLYHQKNKGYPALVNGVDVVTGELFTLKNFDETIEELDILENFYGDGNSKNEYNRVLTDIEINDGVSKMVKASVYFYNCKVAFDENYVYLQDGDWKKFISAN